MFLLDDENNRVEAVLFWKADPVQQITAMCRELQEKVFEACRLISASPSSKGALSDGATFPLCVSGLGQKKGWG